MRSIRTLFGLGVLALGLLFAPLGLAQTPAQAGAQKPVAASPMLFKITDRDTTIYIFGTVHFMPAGMDWLRGPVKQAFDASQTLYLEALIPEDPMQMQAVIAPRAVLAPGGATLRQMLGTEDAARLVKIGGGFGLPAEALDRMQPWFAALTLSNLQVQKLGYDPNAGADQVLRRAAVSAGKKLEAFETVEQQIGFFADLPQQEQMQFLVAGLRRWDSSEADLQRIFSAWSRGDAAGLALINASLDSPTLRRVILDDRNARWADTIKQRLGQPGVVFVAVGAGHLVGPASVQEELKKRGVTVTRVAWPRAASR